MDRFTFFLQAQCKNKKNKTKVVNEINQINKSSTPEECYQQILLLSLADPAGLMQREILLVYSFVETIASLVSLKKEPVLSQANQCIILADEDKPPHYQLEVSTKIDSIVLYMDFTNLYKALTNKKKMFSSAEARFNSIYTLKYAREKPSAELLDYLKQRWFNVDLQEDPLFEDRLDRYIAVGLASTYELQNSLETSNVNDPEHLAQSASDKFLSCVFKQTGVLSVGSLVSFRKKESPKHQRSLGVVDKIVVAKKNGKLYFGMKLLASQIIAVTYQELDAAESDVPKKGLFYNGEKKEVGYIIIDTFIFKDGDIIRLFINNETFPIALKNRKNVGLGYWQFECTRAEESRKQVQTKKGYDFI